LPSLRFATSNYYIGGYHPMGYIGVNQDITEFDINACEFFDLNADKTLHYTLN